MLHELLLAISGYPGSIFTLSQTKDIKIVDSLPFCHPSEREILNQICRLGTSYYQLTCFIKNHNSFQLCFQPLQKDDADKSILQGLYVHALCSGLTTALTPYREDLLRLEQDILDDHHLGLTYVHCCLDKYKMLLPQLLGLVTEIQNQKIHGCQILEVVHRYSASGMPIVQVAMKKIQQACHGVLFRQLTSWLLHGILLDPHKEFFVQKCAAVTATEECANQDEDSNLDRIDECDGKSDARATFNLRGDSVPSYIPMRLAETILFIGESIEMFERKSLATSSTMVADKMSTILLGKEDKFAADLYHLHREEELQLSAFESVVDNIRVCVSEHLWVLVVEKSDLIGHLRALKDMFLMGRGELFLAFIDQADHLLFSTPTTSTEHDVNYAFQIAARSILMEEKKSYLQRFFLKINSALNQSNTSLKDQTFFNSAKCKATGWSRLKMNYIAHWPLHILFTPTVLDKYNTIFQFLLIVRRVQLELERCWAQLMEGKHRRENIANPNEWQLRSCMAFIVNNLQYYLQVDVLECQWNILVDKINATRDFEQIQLAHHNYLTNILMQTFLLMKKVPKYLMEFLGVCLSYCSAIQSSSPLAPQQLQEHVKQFHFHSTLLFQVLSAIRSHQANPHLAQLLKRLDLNDTRVDFAKYFLS